MLISQNFSLVWIYVLPFRLEHRVSSYSRTWQDAWNHQKERNRLVEYAMREERADLVRAALLRTPDDLAAFEQHLQRLSN